jgi:hypothetical protein
MKATVLILVLIIYLSCTQTKSDVYSTLARQDIDLTFDSASWNPKILAVIDSFVKENSCDKCIYELYVNKVLPKYLILNIKARSPSEGYMRSQNPLFMSIIEGKVFYIYSGLEDVLRGDRKRIHIATDNNVFLYKNWTLLINGDSMKINKDGGFPFFPSIDENPYYNKLGVADSSNFK